MFASLSSLIAMCVDWERKTIAASFKKYHPLLPDIRCKGDTVASHPLQSPEIFRKAD